MCRSQIELMVPLAVCSGGLGTISEVKADVEEEPKPSTSDSGQNQGPLMNNGGRDTSNNSDIQKLQQQLQDIKEQVSVFLKNLSTDLIKQLFWFVDDVPRLFGPFEKHDFPLRSRLMSDVRRSNDRVSHLQESRRETNFVVLIPQGVL